MNLRQQKQGHEKKSNYMHASRERGVEKSGMIPSTTKRDLKISFKK